MRVEVGLIWNKQHAKQVAAEYIQKNPQFMWTGQWNTTIPGHMSVIYVKPRAEVVPNSTQENESLTEDVDMRVEVGPIRNQQHAKRVAAKHIKRNPQYMWTGDWSITIPGQMAVIYVKPRAEENSSLTEDVGVDPIWNQELGDEIARGYAREWSGHGRMSVIKVRKKKEQKESAVKISGLIQEQQIATESSYLPTCPICFESLKPGERIFQCTNGHLVCEICKNEPQVTCCPICRQDIVGRATVG